MGMTYVIGQPCVDIKDRACVDECPVDCIYEGARMLYIHPDECVDCGACEPVCPVEAIYYEDDLPEPLRPYIDENVKFFTDTLPGQTDSPWDHPGEPRNSVPSMPTPRWWRRYRRRATDAHRLGHAQTGDGPPGAPRRHPGAAAGLGRAAQHRQRRRRTRRAPEHGSVPYRRAGARGPRRPSPRRLRRSRPAPDSVSCQPPDGPHRTDELSAPGQHSDRLCGRRAPMPPVSPPSWAVRRARR